MTSNLILTSQRLLFPFSSSALPLNLFSTRDLLKVIAPNLLCVMGLLYSHLEGFCKVELRLLFSVNDLILLLEDYN